MESLQSKTGHFSVNNNHNVQNFRVSSHYTTFYCPLLAATPVCYLVRCYSEVTKSWQIHHIKLWCRHCVYVLENYSLCISLDVILITLTTLLSIVEHWRTLKQGELLKSSWSAFLSNGFDYCLHFFYVVIVLFYVHLFWCFQQDIISNK